MLPLLSLQDALTLLWYFLQAVHMDTLSVSEHVMQSSEAVSKLELATFSHEESESNEAPIIRISDGPGWTERGLAGLHPQCSVLGPASSTYLGVISSPHTELYSLLTSASWEWMRVLLP